MLCLVCPTPDDQRPRRSGSDFEALFGDFVRGTDGLWWTVTRGNYNPWVLPPACYRDDKAQAAFYGQFETTPDGRHSVAKGTVFREAMKYLSDFWLEVSAFRQRPEAIDTESWWGGAEGCPVPTGVPRGAEHSFVNVDGAYWAVLSSDEILLRRFAEKWPLARFVPVVRAEPR